MKGKKISVTDDPESARLKENMKVISQVSVTVINHVSHESHQQGECVTVINDVSHESHQPGECVTVISDVSHESHQPGECHSHQSCKS